VLPLTLTLATRPLMRLVRRTENYQHAIRCDDVMKDEADSTTSQRQRNHPHGCSGLDCLSSVEWRSAACLDDFSPFLGALNDQWAHRRERRMTDRVSCYHAASQRAEVGNRAGRRGAGALASPSDWRLPSASVQSSLPRRDSSLPRHPAVTLSSLERRRERRGAVRRAPSPMVVAEGPRNAALW
jgi:hypothetical protein